VTTAKEIAEAREIKQYYPVTRTRKRMKQFEYEGNDQQLTGDGKLKNDFFLVLIDITLNSISSSSGSGSGSSSSSVDRWTQVVDLYVQCVVYHSEYGTIRIQ